MNAFTFSNAVAYVGRKPLPRRKAEEVKRLLREGHSCREASRMTGVSLGKVGEIRKSMETATSREIERLQGNLSDLEQRLSKMEHTLNDMCSALENTYQGHVNPKLGCLHMGKYKGFKCLKCGKDIASALGLGPHLTACYGEAATPPPSSTMPDELDVLLKILQDHGVKYAKPIVDLMSYRDLNDIEALQKHLELSGVHRDRQLLILEAWSSHRNIKVPSNLFKRQVEGMEGERLKIYIHLYVCYE